MGPATGVRVQSRRTLNASSPTASACSASETGNAHARRRDRGTRSVSGGRLGDGISGGDVMVRKK